MSRRHRAEKREVLPDPRYGQVAISKFICTAMLNGEKSIAERIVYGALEQIESKTGQDAVKIFFEALENIKPQLEVRSRRVGGATYQVPMEVRAERAQALAFRWLVAATRSRSESRAVDRLCGELLDASSGRGSSVKRREDMHKMAEANRAFAHYRW